MIAWLSTTLIYCWHMIKKLKANKIISFYLFLRDFIAFLFVKVSSYGESNTKHTSRGSLANIDRICILCSTFTVLQMQRGRGHTPSVGSFSKRVWPHPLMCLWSTVEYAYSVEQRIWIRIDPSFSHHTLMWYTM